MIFFNLKDETIYITALYLLNESCFTECFIEVLFPVTNNENDLKEITIFLGIQGNRNQLRFPGDVFRGGYPCKNTLDGLLEIFQEHSSTGKKIQYKD